MSSGVQSYSTVPLSAGLMDIPTSMLSDTQPRLIASQVRQVQLPSASGNQAPGGVLNFQLSTGVGQGYLKRGSCYLRTTIVITTGATDYSGKALNLPYDRDIGAAGANACPAFGGPLAQASQVINRLTLLSGGSVIEQINNYHVVANIVNSHAASAAYAQADNGLYENSFTAISGVACDSAVNGSSTITVTIPLMSGLLQSQHHLPLFLLSGNLQIQLDLNPQAVGFTFPAAGPCVASFTNNQLIYEQLNVDAVMEATLKQSLMRAPFQIPFNSFVSLAVACSNGSTLSQPIGLNLSSVYGILVTEMTSQAEVNRKYHVKNDLSSIKLFADGRLVNSHQINTDALFYAEMNKVFNLCFDPLRTSAFGAQYSASGEVPKEQYRKYVFTSGVCMNRASEDGVVMSGSPVNQMLVELQHSGNGTTASTAYFIVPHQLIFTVDIAGVAAVIR